MGICVYFSFVIVGSVIVLGLKTWWEEQAPKKPELDEPDLAPDGEGPRFLATSDVLRGPLTVNPGGGPAPAELVTPRGREWALAHAFPLVVPREVRDRQRFFNPTTGQFSSEVLPGVPAVPVTGTLVWRELRSATLGKIYGFDHGAMISWVTDSALAAEGITADELDRAAHENLERASGPAAGQFHPLELTGPSGAKLKIGAIQAWPDGMSSSRVFSTAVHERLAKEFPGGYRIGIPHRNAFMAFLKNVHDSEGVRASHREEPHPISPELHDPADFLPA